MRRRDVGRFEVQVRAWPGLEEAGRGFAGLLEGSEDKMAAAAAETVELHKLKLAELKQECLARGLEAKGNKQDLINRLQTYLEQHVEEETNEEDVLGEETEEEEQKPLDAPVKEEVATEKSAEVGAEKKVVKITSEIPQMERMQKRAERFNVPVSLESKKAARAARFGMSTASTKGLVAESKTTVLNPWPTDPQRPAVSPQRGCEGYLAHLLPTAEQRDRSQGKAWLAGWLAGPASSLSHGRSATD